MNFNQQPVLENERFLIRPILKSDFESLFKAAADKNIWDQHPKSNRYTIEGFTEYFNALISTNGGLVLIDKITSEIFGASSFYYLNNDLSKLYIGYTFIQKSYWGLNTNSEVKSILLNYAFNFVNTVYFQVSPNNFRSQKALKKIGATLSKDKGSDNDCHLEFSVSSTK